MNSYSDPTIKSSISGRLRKIISRRRFLDDDAELLLRSPLNDVDLVEQAESILRRGSNRSGADKSSIDGLPLSCYFDSEYYLDRNPDVRAAGSNPYLHFLRHGLAEARNPHPLIDLELLVSALPARGKEPLTIQALADALNSNAAQPHRYFNTEYYLAANPDVRESGTPALRHYIRHGAAEGRLPHPDFDRDRYIASVADVPNGSYEIFLHCIAHDPRAGGLPCSGQVSKSDGGTVEASSWAGTGGPGLETSRPAGVQGWLDTVGNGVAVGWAHNHRQPANRLEIDILEGQRVVGQGTASLYRGDLHKDGYGDGHCGFAIQLSNLLSDGSPHRLTARVAGASGVALNGELVFETPSLSPRFDILPSWEATRIAEQRSKDWKNRELAEDLVLSLQRCGLLLETDQGQAALSALESIADRHESFELVQIKIGEAHLALNAPKLALDAYERAFKGDSLRDWTLLGMGNCHRLLGNWEDAKDCYMRGLALAPGSAQHGSRMRELEDRARVLSARRFINAGDIESALHALVPGFVLRPEDSTLKEVICEVLEAREKRVTDGQEVLLDPEVRRSQRSVALLGAVLDHFSGSDGERR